MGISPVIVFTDADGAAPHAQCGDQAVAIGASYLDQQRIIDAATRTKADAIHPGYGFLAENADFAEACGRGGFVFVGPAPNVIRSMGLKSQARELAASAGVPVVPAFHAGHVPEFPVLIKASAGGGGRGMRIVRSEVQLAEALESARSEAERSFGDGSLLIERYIENARHVEIQIFGDAHGNVIHLFERDCSVQRRHQKIIEESPSPALDDALRARMGGAAVALGRAIGYTNAGTVEFLVAPNGEFFFIEVNTRIQVEHPVTELITGIDLVRLQIEIAEGKPLPRAPKMMGHAIEARLCAEDPGNDFLPATGTVHVWRPPADVRVDTALRDSVEVGIHYDPLLAKIIAFAMDRESAIRKLIYALTSTVVLGVQTNREYLVQILESEEFRTGRAHTAFLPKPTRWDSREHVAAAVLFIEESRQTPFRGYRNNPFRDPSIKLRVHGDNLDVSWKRVGPQRYDIAGTSIQVRDTAPDAITLDVGGVGRKFHIAQAGDQIFVSDMEATTAIQRLPRYPKSAAAGRHESANSPMPGQVLRILVREGQQVKPGDSLVVLEAMKMEQTIRTTIHGIVQSILVKAGEVVAPGQMLVEISAQETEL